MATLTYGMKALQLASCKHMAAELGGTAGLIQQAILPHCPMYIGQIRMGIVVGRDPK
jgi:hypothetical protein